MTPERWRQIGDVFEAAVRVDPAGREAWLGATCGADNELRTEVRRLLAQDARADRQGLLTPPDSPEPSSHPTATWPARDQVHTPSGFGPAPPAKDGPVGDPGGFTPRAAIVPHTGRSRVSEPTDVVRARLCELPLVYILIVAAATFWKCAVLTQIDPTLFRFMQQHLPLFRMDALVILALVGLVALLWSRWPISLAGLKALELGMIGLLAARITYVQYQVMLEFSRRGDVMMAQLCLKNIVLQIAVLILTYGLYVPKSWRRAAVVAGPLAVLPFATLAALAVRHPADMAWLGEGWRHSTTPRALLFTLDALILFILAVGSTYGARTISRLRLQVAEARQLGQYRLRQRLGFGGMGEVYLAEHQLLKRPCAVKLIRPDDADDPRTLKRFECEVRLTATLSHPNTVEIYDYGRADDGTYYYVMEYIRGLTLAELVERHGPLPPERVVYLLRQVCGALREAHAAGLIHRDIKPSNIFAARRGGMDDMAKLLDFGLVRRVTGACAPNLSAEGQVLGTPLYMAPEQAMGSRQLDERSDIYSLGAVAYFLLTGRPPFEGDGGIAVMIAHARDPVVPPSQLCPDVPEDLEQVVLRCLSKEPTARFPNAGSLERSLGACACAVDWDQDRASGWWQSADASDATLLAAH